MLRDRALALPPINEALARRCMRRTKIFRVLQGIRGAPAVDLPALEQSLIHFARLATADPRLMEIDINPLLAMPSGVLALDARRKFHEATESTPQQAGWVLLQIQHLYRMEKQLRQFKAGSNAKGSTCPGAPWAEPSTTP